MSRAALSILVWGIYVTISGIQLATFPNVMLSSLGLPSTTDPWIRVFGVVLFVLGLYYLAAARQNLVPFFRWTVWGRVMVLAGIGALVASGMAPAQLLIFGGVDLCGAIWTGLVLRINPTNLQTRAA